MNTKKRGLGRGLEALLTNSQKQREPDTASPEVVFADSELQQLPIEFLQPGKYQPRKDMAPDALEDLAASIKAQGIIQPIVVRQVGDQRYEIIAGERRWRAAQLARLAEVPCLVKTVADDAAIAMALIENIQREDLNAMEEAIALQRLLEEFKLTHQEVADAVGKSRATVTNLLRLNNLEKEVKTLLERGDIELGHAKLLLALNGEQQVDAARVIAAKALTVREADRLIHQCLEPAKAAPAKKVVDADIQRLEQRLSEHLHAAVAINHGRQGKGKLVINYSSLDELDGILTTLGVSEASE